MFIHELKSMVASYKACESDRQKHVLATVVRLNGSSYRKPGVGMLIREDGKMTGAVSGGCVEKEVYRQSLEVFDTDKPKLMTYDGRYRLGCEGILYILIEPFRPAPHWFDSYDESLQTRLSISFRSYFDHKDFQQSGAGTIFFMGDSPIGVRPKEEINQNLPNQHVENMDPAFRLVIVGGEHDAVELCKLASGVGWEVEVVTSPREKKSAAVYSGAARVNGLEPGQYDVSRIDSQTAVVLMSHNYATDLHFLLHIAGTRPAYVGLLGPSARKEKLLAELIEREPLIDTGFLDLIHGPAGLDIGSTTPQEIGVSIISEILSTTRKHNPLVLSDRRENQRIG